MNSNEVSLGIVKAIFRLALIVGGIWLILQLKILILYIVVAAVLSLIGRPVNDRLVQHLKFRKVWASTSTIVVLLMIVISIFWLFTPLLIQQSENLSFLEIETLEADIEFVLSQLIEFLNLDRDFWSDYLTLDNVVGKINFDLIPELFNNIVNTIGGFSIGLFSVLFILFFFLKDSNMFQRMVLALVPDGSENRVNKSMLTIRNLLSRYFIGLLMQIIILVVIYTAVLIVFGVKNAFIIALLCALLNLIPYIGPIIGGILISLLTMSSFIGEDFSSFILPRTIYVLIGFGIGQLVDNFFSQPFIYSTSVRSHPLEIFIVILATGYLAGPIGMIVAVPVYTALKVTFKEFLSENKIVKSLTKGYP